MGNRILSVLQGRRLQGTLDLDLPADITRAVRPRTIGNGLKWLRKNYPVDEDAAIMARIEREEREEEERLRRQAEELYRPQSGHWGAPLGEANDIYGKSVLKEIREQNEARLLAEEEKKRKEWLEGEAKEQEKIRMQLKKNTELQKFDEAAVIEGECNKSFLSFFFFHYSSLLTAHDTQLVRVPIRRNGQFWRGFRSIICGVRTRI